ncbi:MAG: AAA family ATPase [Candidatus Marinimicrobia bacterium]|nr:AAA family ATPase [Candidatus Neomarinimicrobiota bacterium]
MITELKSAIRCGVPIISVLSQDEPATVAAITETLQTRPLIQYDIVRGYRAINPAGETALQAILGDADPVLMTDPTTAISAATDNAPENTVIICCGSQRFLSDAKTEQAIANIREPFKRTSRVLILVSSFGTSLPADLSADIYQISDIPPDEKQRETIITDMHVAAEIEPPTNGTLETAITATRGLSAYATEQAVALSMSKNGLNTEQLWQRWRQSINSTVGLSVDMSGATMGDIGGLENIKTFSRSIMSGRDAPAAIIRIEEIEKTMSGTGYGNGGLGDSSGTSQGLLQQILTFMQEENQTGLIAVGPPGSGKSLCSVAIGSAANIPTITLDLGALKGSLVGQTEANTRKALSVVKSLAGKNALWVATCNGMASLPPELRRRFQYGIWFFDLPAADEREKIWNIWLKKYPDVARELPVDDGWTGAEIRTAVQIAYRLKVTPKTAAQWIVPVSKMSAESIESLRKQANGRYLSASKPGVYTYQQTAAAPVSASRKIDLE